MSRATAINASPASDNPPVSHDVSIYFALRLINKLNTFFRKIKHLLIE